MTIETRTSRCICESEPTAAASQTDVFRRNPYPLRGRTLHYSSAIGTEPTLSKVILEQVEAFDREHPEARAASRTDAPPEHKGASFLGELLARGLSRVGEISIAAQPDGRFRISHCLDEGAAGLMAFNELEEAREMTQYTAEGAYRPLKTAGSLKRGWVCLARDRIELHDLLETIYPGSVGHCRGENLLVEPLRTTLNRQTGLYRNTRRISNAGAGEVIAGLCQTTCLRLRLWNIEDAATHRVEDLTEAAWPLLCGCACSLLVEECRKKEKIESVKLADMKIADIS